MMIDPSDINEDVVYKSIKVLGDMLRDGKQYRKLNHAFMKYFNVDLVKPCNHGYTPKQFAGMDPLSKMSIEQSCELCKGTGYIITVKEEGRKLK